jgi:hypothetical protein
LNSLWVGRKWQPCHFPFSRLFVVVALSFLSALLLLLDLGKGLTESATKEGKKGCTTKSEVPFSRLRHTIAQPGMQHLGLKVFFTYNIPSPVSFKVVLQ